MPVETSTDVGDLQRVRDENDDRVPPANVNEQRRTREALGNFAAGVDGTATDDTTGSTLPSQTIPDGVQVVVQALYGNTDRIRVGLTDQPEIEVTPGQSVEYRVANLDQIHIEATTDGDGVAFTAEVTA